MTFHAPIELPAFPKCRSCGETIEEEVVWIVTLPHLRFRPFEDGIEMGRGYAYHEEHQPAGVTFG